jgi:hypothetical protein
VRREEETVHRVLDDSFETLCEERLCACLHAKTKGKKAGRTSRVLHFLADELAELWMTALARCRAAFEAEASFSSVNAPMTPKYQAPERAYPSTMEMH